MSSVEEIITLLKIKQQQHLPEQTHICGELQTNCLQF